MKIHLISDVHIEMADVNHKAPAGADLVVLAGDIGIGDKGLKWARKTFSDLPIIYVAGNHEYYWYDLSDIKLMRKTAEELGIYFLEKDEVILGDVRFLGCTLWTDINKYNEKDVMSAWHSMNDYDQITCRSWWENKDNKTKALELMKPDSVYGFEPEFFSPAVSYILHQESKKWLDQKLGESFDGKTVVVTHHLPSLHTALMGPNASTPQCYYSDLEDFIKDHKIDFWLHGHLHKALDYQIDKTRLVSNPRGYPSPDFYNTRDLCKGFNAQLLIAI